MCNGENLVSAATAKRLADLFISLCKYYRSQALYPDSTYLAHLDRCSEDIRRLVDSYVDMLNRPAKSGVTLKDIREANLLRLREQDVYSSCQDWTPNDWMVALVGEVGEEANLLKKVRRGDFSLKAMRGEIAKESADILAYLDIKAAELGVDLESAYIAKFNEVSIRVGSQVFLSDYGVVVGDGYRKVEVEGVRYG